MMQPHETPDRGKDSSGMAPDAGLGFRPSDDWLSPFSFEMGEGSLMLPGELCLQFPRPLGWKELSSPVGATKLLLMAPEGNGSLVIGADLLPEGLDVPRAIANVAASPIPALVQNGVRIPIVMSIPTISHIRGVDASHMLNFPAMAPGPLLGSGEGMVPFFKYTTVLGIGNKWISFETSSWGQGCNPATESNIMGRLHLGIQISKRD